MKSAVLWWNSACVLYPLALHHVNPAIPIYVRRHLLDKLKNGRNEIRRSIIDGTLIGMTSVYWSHNRFSESFLRRESGDEKATTFTITSLSDNVRRFVDTCVHLYPIISLCRESILSQTSISCFFIDFDTPENQLQCNMGRRDCTGWGPHTYPVFDRTYVVYAESIYTWSFSCRCATWWHI